jgi:tape measure domain-containing protein
MAGTRVGAVEIAITGETDPFRRAMMQAEAQGRRSGQAISREMQRVDAQTRKATASLGGMGSALGALAAVGGLVALGNQLVHVADDFSLMRSRIRLVVAENESLLEIEEKLADQAMTNRADLKSTVALYSRLRAVRKDLSDEAARDIVDKWAKTLIVSGASAQEAAAATMQFGQAMASGRLGGDELRSILEANSRFAILLADGLGVTVGQLRQLGEEGKLTTDAIVGAMKEAGGSLESDFGKKALTVGQATTNLQTAMIRLVGVMDQSAGASATLAKWFNGLSNAVRDLEKLIGGAVRENAKYGEATHNLKDALDQYLKAQLAANVATGQGNEEARAAAKTKREQLREQLRLNEALLAEAEVRLNMARIESLASAGTDTTGYQIGRRARAQERVDDLKRAIDNARATLNSEADNARIQQQIARTLQAGAKAIGLKVTPPGSTQSVADSGAKAREIQELVGYTTDLERLEQSIADIRQASREGAEGGSRAALQALLDYYEASEDLVGTLTRLQELQDSVINPADAKLFSDILNERAEPLDPGQSSVDLTEMSESLKQAAERAFQDASIWQGFGENMRDSAKWALMDAVQSGDWGDALAYLLQDIARNALGRSIDGLFSKAGDGFDFGGWGSAFQSVFGGARAGGGSVMSGRAYRVGELGPETFVPSSDGFIVPAAMQGSSVKPQTGGRSGSVTAPIAVTVQGNLDNVTLAQLERVVKGIPSAVQAVVADRRVREGW